MHLSVLLHFLPLKFWVYPLPNIFDKSTPMQMTRLSLYLVGLFV